MPTKLSGSQIVKRWIIGATAFTVVGGSGATVLFRILNQDEEPIFYADESGNVGVGTETPEAKLDVQGSISGETLFISKAMSGAGLTDCDLTSQKLLWDATTERFTCGTDQSGSGGGSSFNTGALLVVTDNRYVNTSGDTMTGTLKVQSTISGSALRVDNLKNCDTINTDGLGNLSCGTDADTTYAAGQGLSLVGNSLRLNSTITGSLVRFATVSGSLVK
jgi:hypothetical protein